MRIECIEENSEILRPPGAPICFLANLTIFAKRCHPYPVEATMATMNISLPDGMKKWAESQTETGKYSNTSDYVRDLIRQDQERAEAYRRMQTAITAGVESGVAGDFSMDAIQLELDAQDG